MEQIRCQNGVFGQFSQYCPDTCEWRESCKIYTRSNPETDGRISHQVSFDNAENIICAEQPEESGSGARQFASILTYLLSLDDSTFAFICDIIEQPGIRQSELARRRGVSRQRVNTAILHSCRKYPELVPLFRLCVGRRTMLRNRYERKSSDSDSTPYLPGLGRR